MRLAASSSGDMQPLRPFIRGSLTSAAFAALTIAAITGCGDASTSSAHPAGEGGGGGGSVGGTTSGGAPAAGSAGSSGLAGNSGQAPTVAPDLPPRPDGGPGDGASANVQAVKEFELPLDPIEVFQRAYSVDGLKFSNADDPSHCKLQPEGKKKDVVIDGPNGQDNSFGKNVLPVLLALSPSLEKEINLAISTGDNTLLIRVDALGNGKQYSPLVSEIFPAAGQRDASGAPVAPANWQSYAWEPLSDFVTNATAEGDALRSKTKLADGYLVEDTWVSGTRSTIPLHLSLGGQRTPLTVRAAVLVHKYAADRATAESGVISGVLDTNEFLLAFKGVVGKVSSSLCDGATLDKVLERLRAASDIMADGTQSTATCDGISIALGYRTERAVIGPAGVAKPQPPACGP